MLSWAFSFLVLAVIAAALGLGGIAGVATRVVKILFFVFLAAFVASLVMDRRRGAQPASRDAQRAVDRSPL